MSSAVHGATLLFASTVDLSMSTAGCIGNGEQSHAVRCIPVDFHLTVGRGPVGHARPITYDIWANRLFLFLFLKMAGAG